MVDSRFFSSVGPFTLGELAHISGSVLGPNADPLRLVYDVTPLEIAGPTDLSFLDNRKYIAAFMASLAGACVLRPGLTNQAPPAMALLLTMEPYLAYALIAQAFYPQLIPSGFISERACIDSSAHIGLGTEVAAGVVIEAQVEIGKRCQIAANAVISTGVIIGDDCTIGSHVSLSHCIIGHRVVIQPGVCLGQDGFGFAVTKEGFVKVPQLGRVIIGNDVEIGANTTIDRGSGRDTVIGTCCRIDNLVQIGHNVQLGQRCVVVAQVGISGSTKVGDYTMIGGQAGLTGHLSIGARVRIGAQAGVMRDVDAGVAMMGSPAQPAGEYWRYMVVLKQMAQQRRCKVKNQANS